MTTKEEFFWKDRFVKGLSSDKTIRITVVKTTDVVEQARINHELSPEATVILGRALTGAMLMAAQLKAEERVRLVISGDGPIGRVVAEANYVGEIRGYVDHPDVTLDWTNGAQLNDAIGSGTFELSKILYNEAKPITGVVELADATVTGDLAFYIEQSEQIPSMVALDVQINDEGKVIAAAGIMVQGMPGADPKQLAYIQEQVHKLPPLGIMLQNGLYIDDIMVNAMGDVKVREIDRTPVHFYCRCNKDRFLDALALLNVDELADMKGQDQELVCQYCNEHYIIHAEEIERLYQTAKTKLN